MPTHRLALILTPDDHVAIYAAVIQDLGGPGALLDPKVLEPVDERMKDEDGWPRYHGQALLDAMVATKVVAGVCEPVQINGRTGCRGDLAGPVLEVSGVRQSGPRTVSVSILLYTVSTSRDRLYLPFAVEHEYELEKQGVSWAVVAKRRTMITSGCCLTSA
jgi:hypothetical protein